MSYYPNQQAYGTNSTSPVPPSYNQQSPNTLRAQGPDPRYPTSTSGQHGSRSSQQYGQYGQTSPGLMSGQSHYAPGPQSRPAYQNAHGDLVNANPYVQQSYQPGITSPPAQHSPYNPQHYGFQSPPSSPPLRSGFAPAPPNRLPQPYNPAAYQDNSIANAVEQMYGSLNSSPAAPQYGQPSPTSYSPLPPSRPVSMGYQYPHTQHGPRVMPHPSGSLRSNHSISSTLPSVPFGTPSIVPQTSPIRESSSIPAFSGSPSRPRPFSFQLPATSTLHFDGPGPAIPEQIEEEPNWTQSTVSNQVPISGLHGYSVRQGSPDRVPSPAQPNFSQGRPLPGIPMHLEPDIVQTHVDLGHNEDEAQYSDEIDQDTLFNELLNTATAGGGSSSAQRYNSSARGSIVTSRHSPSPHRSGQSTPGQTSGIHSRSLSSAGNSRYRGSATPSAKARYGDHSDDSDAEAAAGLEAMRLAAHQENSSDDQRRSGGGLYIQEASEPPSASTDEGYDYGMDLSGFAGGAYVPMTHRDDPLELIKDHHNDPSGVRDQHPSTSSRSSIPHSSDGYMGRSSSRTSVTGYIPAAAYVDQTSTGGLADPALGPRKLSFDDEADEDLYSYDDHTTPGTDANFHEPLIPHSTSRYSRPLPPRPIEQSNSGYAYRLNYEYQQPSYRQVDPYSIYQPNTNPPPVPRSHSLVNQSNTPRPVEPARSHTDIKKPPRINSQILGTNDIAELQTPATLDLPSLPPGRRFKPSKLTDKDFDACTEPWAMSGLDSWLRYLAEGEDNLKEAAVAEGLTALFINKVPDMNITIVEALVAEVLTELYNARILIPEEEWVRFGRGSVSGVLHQLTGNGCYTPSVHVVEGHGRCYAWSCHRTVKKVNLLTQTTKSGADWGTYYNLTKEEVNGFDKKKIELQNNFHEIVVKEDWYMDNLNVWTTIYRDSVRVSNPPIIHPKRLQSFLRDVFGKIDAVKLANEEHLLPQLKYRQLEQGPWIKGVSDIFRQWIRKAKTAYIEYAASYPQAYFLMKQEIAANALFAPFITNAQNNKLSNRLDWQHYIKVPITKIQQYCLLLGTALKHTSPTEDAIEHANLTKALEEIRAVALECDAKVGEMSKKTDISELEAKIVLRPEMRHVELNLRHLGRELLMTGDLQRMGSSKFTLVQTRAILLDNYLVLAKEVPSKENPQVPKYDVSKLPIPMDLLILESTNDDPVEKSYKGVSTVGSTTRPGQPEHRGTRMGSNSTIDTLSKSTTNASIGSTDTLGQRLASTTILSDNSKDDGKIMYPFQIKHLGRELYTLYAASSQDRTKWCEKILEAKTRHASSLFAQNAEPFKIRVLADAAFAYESSSSVNTSSKAILIKGTPLQRAVADVERTYGHTGRPGPVCRAKVNCATTFRQAGGRKMLAVGTDYGVYLTEAGDVRGWTRAIPALRVSQIAVITEFNLFILISDKTLIAYHLDVVCPLNGPIGASMSENSSRKAPQKLSGSKDVSFFGVGRMKDRTLIFYKKGGGMSSSTFKIIEPVLHRVADRSRTRNFLSRGTLESFREYDDFYIPTECVALEIFTTTLAVATAKGFEVLNLDKKTPFSVPDLKQPHVASIARRVEEANTTPRAMYRLSDLEFLCIYATCAVYVNKHGDISRSVVMEFVGRAKAAALVSGFLVLFDDDFVEVRDAQTGRLKQIIAGRDVRCLDDGKGNGGQQAPFMNGSTPQGLGNGLGEYVGPSAASAPGARTVKFALQHPEQDRTQIVVELVLDEESR